MVKVQVCSKPEALDSISMWDFQILRLNKYKILGTQQHSLYWLWEMIFYEINIHAMRSALECVIKF